MKVVNLQIGLFFKDPIFDPYTLADLVSKEIGDPFDAVEFNIPMELVGGSDEMALAQRSKIDNTLRLNVSLGRCDLFLNPNVDEFEDVQALLDSGKGYIDAFVKSVTERIEVIRLGVILKAFEKTPAPNDRLSGMLFQGTMNGLEELSIRTNMRRKWGDWNLNQIVELGKVDLMQGDQPVDSGLLISRDINNVPIPERIMSYTEVDSILQYALDRYAKDPLGVELCR